MPPSCQAAGVRSGVLLAIAAYALWGLVPLYFAELEPAGAVEVLGHRILWSLGFLALVLAVRSRLAGVRALLGDRRTLRLLAVAAVLVALNWGFYVYAVMTDRVIDAALGYFVTPLVSVTFGLLLLGERLRPVQRVAVLLAVVAVVVLSAGAGGFPWIAGVLALSWGGYGLVKKVADVGAAESLVVETLVLALPAVAVLVVLGVGGDGTFTTEGGGHAVLLAGAGIVTSVPLVLFSASVTRIPLSTAGLLGYITPVMQFLIGWLVAGEDMPATRWAGFALVWIGLVLLTLDGLHASAGARASAEPAPAT